MTLVVQEKKQGGGWGGGGGRTTLVQVSGHEGDEHVGLVWRQRVDEHEIGTELGHGHGPLRRIARGLW
jgi:hypothetical protein